MNFKVTWGNDLMTAFFKGSTLSFEASEGKVHFRNPYVSSGTPLVKWQSNMTYQQARTGVQLPLLKKGSVYQLASDLLLTPSNALLIKVSFYDRSGKRVGLVSFESGGGLFTYPMAAYSYSIELVNAGVETLIFKSLTLTEQKESEVSSKVLKSRRRKH
ncbi:Accessory secretory protein Asp3 [Lactococcus lactis subsp. lactis]|uniref:accessory Sec system protein Asp3 n=1 Tax=Lactococcus lactis TaxID=1358 RepID=UPI00071D4B96|nr:accessory Sec system protein Asp3 [Lactococcus lactis]KST88017.1 Accessory secretory protein Asp3 [Lactococcus lactis subsp. lactis]